LDINIGKSMIVVYLHEILKICYRL